MKYVETLYLKSFYFFIKVFASLSSIAKLLLQTYLEHVHVKILVLPLMLVNVYVLIFLNVQRKIYCKDIKGKIIIAASVNLISKKNIIESAIIIVTQSNQIFINPVKIKSFVCSTSLITLDITCPT